MLIFLGFYENSAAGQSHDLQQLCYFVYSIKALILPVEKQIIMCPHLHLNARQAGQVTFDACMVVHKLVVDIHKHIVRLCVVCGKTLGKASETRIQLRNGRVKQSESVAVHALVVRHHIFHRS